MEAGQQQQQGEEAQKMVQCLETEAAQLGLALGDLVTCVHTSLAQVLACAEHPFAVGFR